MDYTLWERVTAGKRIAQCELTPRCDLCKARTHILSAPQLFLLPVHNDKRYTPSAEYYSRACRPLARVEDIPIGQRACRMWPLVCPKCEARAVLVVDFLRVRGEEVPEETVVCDYAPLAAVLNGAGPAGGAAAPGVQSFGHRESVGNDWRVQR